MAIKQSVTPQDVCDLMNELLKLDYACASGLINYHQPCNKTVADHPTIQVRQYGDEEPSVGILGILNGMFGIREDGMGAICYEIDLGEILRFIPTPPPEIEKILPTSPIEVEKICGTCGSWQTCANTEGWRINSPCTHIDGCHWEPK
jgi:hypothetical protein